MQKISGGKMMEAENKEEKILCHGCRFGGGIVECCHCPQLSPWRVMPKTIKNIQILAAGEAVARSKGINFNPLAHIAVVSAVEKGECYYYKPLNKTP